MAFLTGSGSVTPAPARNSYSPSAANYASRRSMFSGSVVSGRGAQRLVPPRADSEDDADSAMNNRSVLLASRCVTTCA
jgi:hypothetical protein